MTSMDQEIDARDKIHSIVKIESLLGDYHPEL